jgi:conjugal transfer ATP-binding protein TraC
MTDDVKREQSYFGEYHFNDYLWPVAYEEERQFYYMEAPGEDKLSYVGFSFMCEPLAGFSEKTIAKLQAIFAAPFPAGSFMHMMLYKSPDMTPYINRMIGLRDKEKDVLPILRDMLKSKGEFMESMTDKSMSRAAKTYVHNSVFQLDVKVPIKAKYGPPAEEDLDICNELMVGLKQVLETCGMRVNNLPPEELLRFFGSLLNWNKDAGWKMRDHLWSKDVPIRDQIKDGNNSVKIHKSHLQIGEKYLRMLTPRRLPEDHQFWITGTLFGDAMSGKGINQNVAYSLVVHFPDAEETKQEVQKKHTSIKYQAFGPMLKWFPEIGRRLEALDLMQEAMAAGDRSVQIFPSIMLFSSSEEELIAATSNLKTSFREKGWIMVEDNFIQTSLLLNQLPFGADPGAHKFLGRYGTVAARHAVQFLPVVAEWKGSGTPAVTLFTRNNQVMSLDFFDSNTNYNGVIAAASGSGKSFFANELITSYLSMGSQFFVIDVGRSYKNLCDELKGEFIEFTEDSNICLNPFSFINNFDEDCESLVGTIVAMVQENDGLTDPQLANLRIVLGEVWGEKGKSSQIDDVANKLRNSNDQRMKDMGNQLYPFTSKGNYGKWFIGDATVSFKNNFTCLELEELKAKPPLQRVVLLMLISQIQYAMYLGGGDKRKFLIIDEAWELLSHPSIAKFIEGGYRKFRKYRGSAFVITQNINDLYGSASGKAIADNSAWKLLLGQTAEAIEQVKKEGRLSIGDWGFEMMKSVHTLKGEYSEVFVYYQDGMGIGRLIVPPFNRILYSTAPDDRMDVKKYMKQGMTVGEAINQIVRDRGMQ